MVFDMHAQLKAKKAGGFASRNTESLSGFGSVERPGRLKMAETYGLCDWSIAKMQGGKLTGYLTVLFAQAASVPSGFRCQVRCCPEGHLLSIFLRYAGISDAPTGCTIRALSNM
jgi:hypothetical protein